MSATVVLSARLAEEKLEAFLKEVQEMDLTLLEQMLTEQMLTCQQDSLKKKIMRLKLHIDTFETNWIQYIQGGALLAVRGYDITSENYDVIRKVLIEKFGQSHIIKKSLYNESYSVKKNDRQWKITVEATERILRQLEAMDENLEQSSTGITTENKLLAWFLDRV
ncbi:Uncharacterized protein BM_BM17104 [Brugia malayi]|uniref:Gag protein n=1 Tax=Brugia malayi TaxID=6279 RepID=A0A158PUR2_BRUMA|nr:Uncharacterized protein BM_BM17103 [Brugia malayi]XP_042938725.1 Uncharacterized protein BM_BM17104 [Brugia malayi]VIO99889.1 Uncharacterized protein BM_BM17103 [Brugia malayi]VIO99896.1 Uncharacterized protein BM_BM17104 [Brugia malayi]